MQPRGEATVERLLEAAAEILVEEGWAALTTTRISERSGVSRGAQQHHFPTRADLIGAAIEWLGERRRLELVRRRERLPPSTSRAEAAIDLLWEEFCGPLFDAGMELWVAARTDPELRALVTGIEHAGAERIADLCADLFGPELSARPGFDERVLLAISTMRGVAMLRFLDWDELALARHWRYARWQIIGTFA